MRRFDPQPQPLEPLVHSLELKAVLVVDDDQQLASALQSILADENFLVDVAFDGEQAMMKVKAHEYDADLRSEDAEAPRRRILSEGGSAAVSGRSVHIHHRFRGRSVDRALLQQARSEIFGQTVSHRGAD